MVIIGLSQAPIKIKKIKFQELIIGFFNENSFIEKTEYIYKKNG